MDKKQVAEEYQRIFAVRFSGIKVRGGFGECEEGDIFSVYCIPDDKLREYMLFMLDELPNLKGDLPDVIFLPCSNSQTKELYPSILMEN